MRFLIVNTDYPQFLRWLYAQHPGLEGQPYEAQAAVRNESLFGVAGFYSRNLHELGHQAYDIHANNEPLQKAWAREHGMGRDESVYVGQGRSKAFQRARRIASGTPVRYLKPLLRPLLPSPDTQEPWFYEILAAQIKHCKPEVLLNQTMGGLSSQFLREMRPYVRLLVGQHAATPLAEGEDFSCYDLVVSSFPPTLAHFRLKGIPAELSRVGFEPRVLSYLESDGRVSDVTFVGSLYDVHRSRAAFLEALCTQFRQMRIWGSGVEHLSPNSSIRSSYVGEAWGREMYQIVHDSRITLNHHGDIAPYANNCRLFEATGVGSLLVTDWKENLHEMFEPGVEVVAYRTPLECAELIRYYLEHDQEREAIASAGQERTLKEHTYSHRMQELVQIVRKYLN